MEIKPTAIYSRKDVMDMLSISTTSLQKFVSSGDLKARNLSNKWVFTGKDILDFIERLPAANEPKK